VTITGTNFTPTATVSINATAATGVTYVSASQLTATLPARPAGTYSVLVTTGGVTSAANPPADQYTYVPAPTVTSVTPTSGSTAGGTSVTITGTNLTGATAVTFGGNAATNVVIASNGQSLTATTPAGAAGTTTIAVTTPGGTGQLAGGYTYVVLTAPTVTGAPQNQTVAVGASATFSVTVSGSPPPAVQWQVSSDSGASFTNIAGETGTSYTTPATIAGDNGNQYRAVVTNSAGTATSTAATLTVVQAPTANAQTATVAYQTARAITLAGTDPNSPARTLTYTVATQPQHGTLSGAAPNLTYTPAAGYFGADSFTFTVSNGVSTSAPATVTLMVQQPLPVVNAISPNQGQVAGGTPITISGTGFTGVDPPTGVRIGGTLATGVTINSDTQLVATTPAGAIGLASVTVTNSTGTNAANTLFRYVGAPTATDQSVSTGFNTARAITLTGTDPNTPARTLTYTVATQPQHGTLSGAAPNLTYTPTANYVGSDSFTFTVTNGVSTSAPGTVSIGVVAPPAPAAPVVTAPASGSVTNDTTPTITGTTAAGSTVNVYIDGALSGSAIVAGTSFSYTPATALNESTHTVYAIASNVGGPSPQSATNAFTVDSIAPAAPTITVPTEGSETVNRSQPIQGKGEPGTTVQAFVDGAQVGSNRTVNASGDWSIGPQAPFALGQRTATARVIDRAGNVSPNSTPVNFTIVTVAVIDAITPTQGSTTGGTTVTITGSGLNSVTAVRVGGVPGVNIQHNGDNVLSFATPAGTIGAKAVVAVNSAGSSNANITFTYVAPPVADAQNVSTAFNTATTITLTASGNPTSYTVATPPTRGTLSGVAPNLTYTPTAGTRGTDSFTFTAGNAVATSAPATVSIAVGDPAITVGGTPPSGQRGAAYAAQLTASGGTAPYGFTVASGTLPPGLTISATGAISGTPTASGSFQVAFTVTDTSNPAASVMTPTYTIAIAGPTASISPAAGGLPSGTIGTAYSRTFSTSGATAPYSYAATGTLPPGLSLAADGRLAGTPTGSGSFSFTVTSTDSSTAGSGGPYTASAAYTLAIQAPTITVAPAALPNAVVGQAYSQQLGAAGGTGPYAFTTAGPLPAGVTLSPAGSLSGTPSQTGSFTFTVVATDSSTGGPGAGGAYSGARSYTLAVAAPTITVNPATIPGATAGQAYAQDLTASGGSGSYTFARSAGALPPGITLSAGGRMSGTPTAGGNFTFTVTATDGGGFTGARAYILSVAAATVAVAPATLPDGIRGVGYSQTLTAAGGTAPYAFSVTGGALPGGLSLATDGTLTGQPTAVGSFTFTVAAQDSSTGNGPFAGSRTYTVAITAATIALAPATLPTATTRTAYSQTLSATGGTAPYRYAVSAGTLPAGIALATDGTLSGSATAAGSFTFTATATDAFGNTGARSYTLAVGTPTITLAPTTLPDATTRIAYSQTIAATGGAGSYSYAVTAGALPGGLTLAADGTLSGAPIAAGSFTFTVAATDGNANTGAQGYTLGVVAPTIALAPATLPDATTRIAYSQAITATGGAGSYSYTVTAGALPGGLTLAADGTLSGSPSAAGSFTFTVTATDANGNSGSRGYTVAVQSPAITLAPATLADGTVGAAYAGRITATGGGAGFGYAVTAGALPNGLTLATDGALAGTPSAGGSFAFTVTATDIDGNTGNRAYTLAIDAPTVVVAPAALPAATRNVGYSRSLTASGGTAPYSYAVTAGALPAGVTLATDGTLSGFATVAGSYGFTVTATDASAGSGPYAGARNYTLVVAAPTIALTPATLPDATTRIAYSQAITATGGAGSYSYAVTSGTLPGGLTLSTGGALSGVPTAAGSHTFTVTATDANGNTGAQGYTLAVATPAIIIAPTTLPTATTRATYVQAITASGGTAPYSYAVTAGALPGGLTLAADGTLSGAPTATGSFTFTVTATDANGNFGAQNYTIAVQSPAITLTSASLADGMVGTAYAGRITATGGSGGFRYAVTAGALPAGIQLATDGALSGTPNAGGNFAFTATATDAGGNMGNRAYTLAIAAPTVAIAPATLPTVTSNVAYSQSLSASGGTAPYSYAVTAGALPAGLTLATDGTLSGTATVAGSYGFTVTVADASTGTGPYTGTRSYTLVVTTPTITLAPAALPGATTRIAYGQAIIATGGAAPYSYAVTAGALPAGLTLSTDGTLAGSASATGRFTFTVVATDADGNIGSRGYALDVAAPAISIAPATLPAATTRAAYSQAIIASGGAAPYAYAVTAGTLPSGLTLSTDGTLSGSTATAGSYDFTVAATDANGNGAAQRYTLAVIAPTIVLAPATLPDATTQIAYSQALMATGGAGSYTYTVTAGALPGGLTLATGGTLSGSPTAAGSFTFTVTVTDANGNAGTLGYTLTVGAPAITLAPATLPGANVATAYITSLSASGGAAPYGFAVTGGALPAGVTLAADGTLSGTPTAGGSFTFEATVADANRNTGSRSYTLAVAAPALSLAPAALSDATTRVAYRQSLSASGGVAPHRYAVTAGSLPAGLALGADGTLSGTPTASGSFGFTVTATDSATGTGPYAAARAYTLVVAAPTIALAPTTLPGATTRVAYSQPITASGGTGSYSYAVTAGALPGGLTLATGGTLSGSPSVAGSFTFTIAATDANGNSGSRGYTIEVAAPAIVVAPTTLPDATTRATYSQAITASGGAAPYTYAVTAGALPAGLTLSTGGALSGSTATAGRFTFTVTATDANGNGAAQAYTLAVTAPTIALTPTALPDATTRIAYRQAITATGGAGSYSYAVTAGALPGGLTLSTDGTLSGSPTAAGSFTFTIAATDANGNVGAQGYTIAVQSPAITLAPVSLADGTVGTAYAGRVTATGGSGGFGYSVTAGALPAGIALATDGTLSSTPIAGGSYTFTVTATDADGNTGNRAYTLAIAAPTIALAPETLPAATTRVAYRQSLSANGGVAPYRFTVTMGTLPAGMTLGADGTLAGTPTTSGSFGFTVTATDSATGTGPYAGARAYTLVVAAPSVALSPTTLPGGTIVAAYAADLTATGGTAPYGFAVTAGALPGGVTLSGAGRLAGTPNAAGPFAFTVTATDANGNSGAQAYTVAIAQAAQTISFADPGARSLSASPLALTATASSGLPVSFVSTTTGVCTVSGSSVTLLRTGTCTVEARQDGNANIAAATPVAQSFAVTAARLAASQAQASVSGQTGVPLIPVAPVTITGGTAPYAYALSGGTLPTGLAFAADTGTLSGTPVGGQDATAYTVTVRDAGGQTASAGFKLAVTAPTLAIGQTTLPDGAFQAAYSQQLTVSGGTQPYRFAVTAGALPAGLSLSASGLVSGTPTAFGRFPLTITATDSSTGTGPYSAAQAYTLVVAAPTIPTAGNAAVTVAYGSSDTVVTPPLTGEVTALAIATQPSHGTARVDGRTLVYTSAAGYAGPDSFTYTASNAGGASAPGTVSVTVSAPAVTITPATLPDARQGDAYSQQLTAAGGTAPYTFAVASGTLPAGLTLSTTGLVSGNPTASGSATFTVRATDSSTGAGPFSVTQSYTLAVGLPAAPTVRPVPTVNAPGSSTAANMPTTIVLSDYVSGNFTSIVVVTPPQNGSVTLTTTGTQTTATYTPRTNFSGTDGFSFAAVGPGGRSPVSSIALSITGTAPVVRALTASAVQGTPVTVDLTAAVTGGPFTAAAVTGVSPTASVQTAVVEGGSAGARTYSLVLTPSLSFSGTATVTYTLSNQFGASAPASVTLSVAARPDPSGDANVNGLSAAQAEATRRFARSQTENFFRRNEQLHNGGNGTGGRDMGVGFQVAELGGLVQSTVGNGLAPDTDDVTRLKSEHARAVLGAELAAGAVTMSQGGMNGIAGLRGRQVLQQGTAAASETRTALGQATGEGQGGDIAGSNAGERRVGSVGIWSGGAVTVGAWDKDADRAKLTLTTSGLSAGADIKLADNLIVGAGGGYGADLTKVGGGAARVRGRSWSVAGYGSWAPTDGLFVDGIFGGGSLDFDTRRQVAQTGAVATGSRDGSMLFGSLAAGFDRRGAVDLSAYGRVDWLSARLDRYTESGGGIYGLTYGRRDLDSVASVLGLRVGYPQPGWTPRVRGEWRHEFADSDAQLIDYADVANLRYATRGDFWIRDAFTIDVGVEFGLGRGWGVAVDVGASGGSGATAGTARLGVRKEF
jgi:uncharacterized protein YhjY with autotransporter beta-barrel domain